MLIVKTEELPCVIEVNVKETIEVFTQHPDVLLKTLLRELTALP